MLDASSKALSKDYERQFRALETEWADMYQKFQRIVGRMDRNRALEPSMPTEVEPEPMTRSDLLRRFKRRGNHEQAGTHPTVSV